jgi:signal transduction histidine kinase/ligand-binding sensor domain-containing protein
MTSWCRHAVRSGLILAIAGLVVGQPRAERLPIRTYTMEDGLPSDDVRGIERDSHGYLWFLTDAGLCRFDGLTFTVFGADDGLPRVAINDFLETRNGTILVATDDGVYWYDPSETASRRGFRLARPDEYGGGCATYALVEDRSGTILCAARTGVQRMKRVEDDWRFDPVDTKQPADDIERNAARDLVVDDDGSLWIATPAGLIWIAKGGANEFLTERDGLPHRDCFRLTLDSMGRVWVALREGVAVLASDPATGRPVVLGTFDARDGLVDLSGSAPHAWSVLNADDGTFWATTSAGLARLFPNAGPDEPALRNLDRSNGLVSADLASVQDDPAGNLWLGSFDAGVMRVSRGGFVTYGATDGLYTTPDRQIFDGPDGELIVIGGARYVVHRFDGKRFHRVTPRLPSTIDDLGWGRREISFRDSRGEWWFGTFGGLVRFPAVTSIEDLARVRPKAHYTEKSGLLSNGVFRLYEDSRGDLWVGAMHYTVPERNGLQRWDRATETFRTYGEADGVPHEPPTAIREDAAGNIWVGFDRHGVGRFRDGVYEPLTGESGAPVEHVTTLHLDRRRRVWIGVAGGVVRVDEPDADTPVFHRYGRDEGLTGSLVTCLTEDLPGRIYLGSRSGVDRLDPETGEVRHYSRADGLASNMIFTAHRDPEGALWFGTSLGLSKLVPREDSPSGPPPVRILGLRIAGRPYPVSPFGETDISGVRLSPTERQLEIDYSGLSFVTGDGLRFQFRLEGTGATWSEPDGNRRVQFASLSPGSYRFAVRAVNSSGLVSPEPAMVGFRVLPPFWRTWWFAAGLAAIIGALAFAFHRARLKRVMELERVRTRIATDLHDDIGASLSQVSILTEVVRQRIDGDDPTPVAPLLDQIAGSARDLVDSMSDIVWAVNPKRDRAADLVQRMRRFASDTLSGKGIAFELDVATGDLERRLDVELRRQVYLVFKEAVHNLLRHSGCAEARIELWIDARMLKLRVTDDGRGFDADRKSEGHGLASMRRRAADLGGTLEIESAPGRGSTIVLRVPLGKERS